MSSTKNLGSEKEVIEDYYNFAVAQAVSITGWDKENLDDHIQNSLMGLIHAYRNYNQKLGSFQNFARTCIRNAILKGLRKKSNIDSVSNIDKEVTIKYSIWEILPDNFTDAERVVVEMKLQNYTYNEISDVLYFTKSYVKQIYKKAIDKIRKSNE